MRFLEFLGRFIIPRQSVRAQFTSAAEQQAYLERLQKEHAAILDAIRAKKPDRARAAARLHLIGSLESIGSCGVDRAAPLTAAPPAPSPHRTNVRSR
jgi:DNA-binding FadR family transcriptional regulator